MQLIVAAVVGVAATVALRRSRFGRRRKTDAARDPNVNLDIGQTRARARVAWQRCAGHARAMYRGALWDVELAPGEPRRAPDRSSSAKCAAAA